MNLTIDRFKQAGDISSERVVLKVEADTGLGNFMLARSEREDTDGVPGISSGIEDVLWFPEKDVKEGDFVLVYTGGGEDRSFKNRNGSESHVFHLGQTDPIWTDGDDAAVIFELSGWDFRSLKDEDSEAEEEVESGTAEGKK